MNCWADLPRRYVKPYLLMAANNRRSRLYASDAAADSDAFQQVRDQVWRDDNKCIRQEGRDQLGLLDARDNAEGSD